MRNVRTIKPLSMYAVTILDIRIRLFSKYAPIVKVDTYASRVKGTGIRLKVWTSIVTGALRSIF